VPSFLIKRFPFLSQRKLPFWLHSLRQVVVVRHASVQEMERKAPRSTPSAPSVNHGGIYVKSPEIEFTPKASITVDTGTAGTQSSLLAVRTPVAAPSPQMINLVSPEADASILTKRNRLRTEIFDPSDVRSIHDANEYRTSEQNRAIAATTTHAQIEA